jgi:hypothetical protein
VALKLAVRWVVAVGSDSRRGGGTRFGFLCSDNPKLGLHIRWFGPGCTECRCGEEKWVTALVRVWNATSRSLWAVDGAAEEVTLRVRFVFTFAVLVCVVCVGAVKLRGCDKVLCARGPRRNVLERREFSPEEATSVAACETGGTDALVVVGPLLVTPGVLSAVAGRTRRLLTTSDDEGRVRGWLGVG